MTFAHEVPVNVVDRFRKKRCRIFPTCRRREVGAKQKNLVHAYVESVGMEGIDDLVHQLKNYFRDVWIQRIPFAAVEALIARECFRRGVERWVDSQERKRLTFP